VVNERSSAKTFLTLEELSVLFPRLKKNEAFLDIKERQILNKIEKILYENFSIADMENHLGGTVEYT
jgi:hypothetical protein